MTLKQQFEEKFIPAIKEMIEAEKRHLEMLKSRHNDYPDFIMRSESYLYHYTIRLNEYIEYAKNLEE